MIHTMHWFGRALLLLLLLSSCATGKIPAEQMADKGELLKAVLEYRQVYAEHPSNIEYKSRLKQLELLAADHYYRDGMKAAERGMLDEAIFQFQQGLVAMPEHSKLKEALQKTVAKKEADYYYREGVSLQSAGKIEDAVRAFKKALMIFPDHAQSVAALEMLQRANKQNELSDENWGKSDKLISLRFRGTDLRTAFEFIASSFNMNVIFDEDVKAIPVTIFAKNVTFIQALSLLGTTTKTFYKRIGPNTIIIAPDTPNKRGQYEDYITRIYYLKTIRAKEMYDVIKNLISPKKIVVEEKSNSLLIRDTAEVLHLVDNVIADNDRKPPEIIFDVEILEVNRSKADKLGLDLGTYEVSVGIPSATPVPLKGSIPNSIAALANLTLPSATLRFYRQQVDAKTLANPRIRTLNGEAAHIHIGDRVPLQASRIIDATGQVRTTFDYREIGIGLDVEPRINLDNSVQVKLALEVSSLGENLGTANEPAYRIGTRNAQTVMLLRDGETAILGGLIRDEDRTTRLKVPGLGDIPAAGALFTSHDISGGRTDVLLTITPRVIRGWDLPPREERQFFSGSASRYLDRPLFGEGLFPGMARSGAVAGLAEEAVKPSESASVGFSRDSFSLKVGEDSSLKMVGHLPTNHGACVLDLLFDPKVIDFVRAEAPLPESLPIVANADPDKGVLHLVIPPQEGEELGTLVFHGKHRGSSYLLINALSFPDGKAVGIEPKPASVMVE